MILSIPASSCNTTPQTSSWSCLPPNHLITCLLFFFSFLFSSLFFPASFSPYQLTPFFNVTFMLRVSCSGWLSPMGFWQICSIIHLPAEHYIFRGVCNIHTYIKAVAEITYIENTESEEKRTPPREGKGSSTFEFRRRMTRKGRA